MRLVLLGGPGAGKGTQAVILSHRFSVPHISTGDIFRSNIKEGTLLGKKAGEFIDKGLLVPDDLTVDIVKQRLAKDDCKQGFILDGFPRTVMQAEYLDNYLKNEGEPLDAVLEIDVSDEVIVRRLSGRRICPSCGAIYHIAKMEGNACTLCKKELIQRQDDNEVTIKKRLHTYHSQTKPLIEYYINKGLLIKADGDKDPKDIADFLTNALSVRP